MLIHKPDGKNKTQPYEFVDFRETAPAAATENMFKDNVNASIYGGQARYDTPCSAMLMTDSLLVVCPVNYEV